MNRELSREYTAKSYSEHRSGVWEDRAREIHRAEMDARPGRPRIQPGEIKYLKTLLEKAPDAETVERLI